MEPSVIASRASSKLCCLPKIIPEQTHCCLHTWEAVKAHKAASLVVLPLSPYMSHPCWAGNAAGLLAKPVVTVTCQATVNQGLLSLGAQATPAQPEQEAVFQCRQFEKMDLLLKDTQGCCPKASKHHPGELLAAPAASWGHSARAWLQHCSCSQRLLPVLPGSETQDIGHKVLDAELGPVLGEDLVPD